MRGTTHSIRAGTGASEPVSRAGRAHHPAHIELEYGSIRWTVDTLGWKGAAGGQSAESVRVRVLPTVRPGAIMLMHVGSAPDGSTLDADALPSIIEAVRARGYRFVDLTEFLAAA